MAKQMAGAPKGSVLARFSALKDFQGTTEAGALIGHYLAGNHYVLRASAGDEMGALMQSLITNWEAEGLIAIEEKE